MAASVCLGLCPAPAAAFVHYDFEQPLFSEAPQPVLDHCVVEHGGVYHLFYLRGNPAVNIGHATTLDFVHWTTLPPVLTGGTWDQKLWAPYLCPSENGSWLMYFTGVNAPGAQQSGVASSFDLMNWYKWPEPIYHPETSWALWNSGSFSHGRDPHIFEYQGQYYMFVTAKTTAGLGAVACAVSDDLLNWEDIGPIFVNNNWHVMESVFVLEHGGKFHMFFTEEAVYGTSHMYSDNLLSGWDLSTRRIIDSGHAPQITDTHLGQVFSRHSVYNNQHGTIKYTLRFTPMIWFGDYAYVPKPLPLANDWTQVMPEAFYYQPTYGNNAFVRNEIYPSSFVGDSWINTYEYYTGPMGYGSPGSKWGEGRVGMIHSQPFTVQGNSMSLLVGGGNYPSECYVALMEVVNDTLATALYSETGKNSDVMDVRYWNLRPHIGKTVYLEIADLSTGPFGHIDVDEIVESPNLLPGDGMGTGRARNRPNVSLPLPLATSTPDRARLLPNSPNPFNPSTTIAFEVPLTGRVRVDVFDARGALVRTLLDAERPAGRFEIEWNGTDARGNVLASGVYFYRLHFAGRSIETRKMVLLK